jgi:hypothetical protein
LSYRTIPISRLLGRDTSIPISHLLGGTQSSRVIYVWVWRRHHPCPHCRASSIGHPHLVMCVEEDGVTHGGRQGLHRGGGTSCSHRISGASSSQNLRVQIKMFIKATDLIYFESRILVLTTTIKNREKNCYNLPV